MRNSTKDNGKVRLGDAAVTFVPKKIKDNGKIRMGEV